MLLSAMKSMLRKMNIPFNDGGKQSVWESDVIIIKINKKKKPTHKGKQPLRQHTGVLRVPLETQ